MKKSLGKSQPVSVVGYGERIRRAIWLKQSQSGGRITLAAVGETVAKAIGRDGPFSAGTVSGWLEERSEPPLAVFLALARWTGLQVGYLAFGDEGREDAERYQPATETPPGYYDNVTEPDKVRDPVSAKKRRGA